MIKELQKASKPTGNMCCGVPKRETVCLEKLAALLANPMRYKLKVYFMFFIQNHSLQIQVNHQEQRLSQISINFLVSQILIMEFTPR